MMVDNYVLKFLLFLGISLIPLVPFIIGLRRSPLSLLMFPLGSLALLSVFYIQIPLQRLWIETVVGTSVPLWLRNTVHLGISGFIQEFFKAIGPVLVLLIIRKSKKSSLLFGLTAGAGFGFMEAFYLLKDIPFSIYPVLERSSAIIFHISATGLVLISLKRIYLTYFTLSISHSIMNSSILLFKRGTFSILQIEIFIFLFSLFFYIILLIMGRKFIKGRR